MSSIDETKHFIPLNIAVLTISDTRTLADDKSGTTLSERLTAAGHKLGAREIVTDDVEAIRSDHQKMDRRSRHRCDHHHRRYRLYRARRDAGGRRAAVRKADGRLLDRVPHAEPRQDRHLGDPEPRHRRRRRRDLYLLPAGIAGRLPRRAGTAFWPPSSITGRGPAISSRSCRGWTSICAARRRRARRRNQVISGFAARAPPRNDAGRDATASTPRSRRRDRRQSYGASLPSPGESRRADKFRARRPECSGSRA